jgi:hypothetical protein
VGERAVAMKYRRRDWLRTKIEADQQATQASHLLAKLEGDRPRFMIEGRHYLHAHLTDTGDVAVNTQPTNHDPASLSEAEFLEFLEWGALLLGKILVPARDE